MLRPTVAGKYGCILGPRSRPGSDGKSGTARGRSVRTYGIRNVLLVIPD